MRTLIFFELSRNWSEVMAKLSFVMRKPVDFMAKSFSSG